MHKINMKTYNLVKNIIILKKRIKLLQKTNISKKDNLNKWIELYQEIHIRDDNLEDKIKYWWILFKKIIRIVIS